MPVDPMPMKGARHRPPPAAWDDTGPSFIPHPHQSEAQAAILSARAQGRPGFLLGDLTGLGKTLSAWLAISAMPETDILVDLPERCYPAMAAHHRGLAGDRQKRHHP